MMRDMHRHGVFPSVWKLEMQSTQRDWKKLATIAKAPMILLGHGESKTIVDSWVTTAAKSGVVNGFAIGRTIFLAPIKSFLKKEISRTEAVKKIAKNYLYFIKLWAEHAKS
jgi:5-dehydro-2-deoxygluconokinase